MAKIEGIVVQVTEKYIVLLSNTGAFQNVPLDTKDAPPLIGQTYSYVKKTRNWFKYAALASVILLAVVSMVFLPILEKERSYLVAIDINPSFEMILNSDDVILETSANNLDGENLLLSLSLEGMSLEEALDEIIGYSEEQGYFEKEGIISATLIPLKEDDLSRKETILQNSLAKEKIEVHITHNSKQNYDQAKENHLSVNHYHVFQQLQKAGIVQHPDEVKEKSVGQLMKMKHGHNEKQEKNDRQANEKQEKSENGIDNNKSEVGDVNSGKNKEEKATSTDQPEDKSQNQNKKVKEGQGQQERKINEKKPVKDKQ